MINRTLMPIGVSDFRKLIEYKNSKGHGYLFADKTQFIEEIDDDGAEVILITRPRRFGKTLNLSMLHHFFAPEVDGKPTKDLFNNLEISKNQKIINNQQGKYPVIFLTFKDIKQDSMQLTIESIAILISMLFETHRYLLQSESLSQEEKDIYLEFIKRKSSQAMLEKSLQYLNLFLYNHFKQQAIILIDEYDSPIQEAYLNGYYDKFIKFMRGFFGSGLKDNGWFKKAILTGITRVSKESLFSGVNNPKTYTLLSDKYSSYFGFTENDVTSMIEHTQIDIPMADIKAWYNGYQCGNSVIYNPWSIINCLDEHGKLKPFWINTSGNELVKKLMLQSGNNVRDKLQQLIQEQPIQEIVDEYVVFANLENNNASAIWSLLLMAGYLKIISTVTTNLGIKKYILAVPNKEVKYFYHNMITNWISGVNGLEWYESFLNSLISGEINKFTENLQKMLNEIISVHDTGKTERESFYHGLILGLIVGLGKQYEIKSNKESGLGFYDIAMFPRDNKSNNLGILMELKKADFDDDLPAKAEEAFAQINTKNYDTEFKARGIKKIVKLGIAFSAKKLKTKYEITLLSETN